MDFLHLLSRCPLSCWIFVCLFLCFLAPGQACLNSASLWNPSLLQFATSLWDSHGYVSRSSLPFSVWSLSCFLCRNCYCKSSLRSFSGWNCFICRCIFSVLMGGSEFRVFPCCYLGPASLKIYFQIASILYFSE